MFLVLWVLTHQADISNEFQLNIQLIKKLLDRYLQLGTLRNLLLFEVSLMVAVHGNWKPLASG